MSTYAGPADWWTDGTNDGRTHVATKGIVQSGLVLNLDAGVSNSYPGTGTTWADLSGNGFNSTLVNGVGYNTTNGGRLVFDGVDDTVTGVHSASLDLTGSVTCEAWFRLTNTRTDWVRVLGKGDSTNRTYGLWYNQSTSAFLYQRYGSSNIGIGYSATVELNTWYHLVGTSSGTSHVMYLNGVIRGSTTSGSTFFSSTNPYTIAKADTMHTFHVGEIAVARIYNRGLSLAEVLQNFNATRSRYGI